MRLDPTKAFVFTGVLSFVGGIVWLALHPELLEAHFYRPDLIGLTHILTLGWISMMILGILGRLSPMLFQVDPPGRKLTWVVYALWVIGGSGIISHMWWNEPFGVWTSALCLWIAIALLFPLHRGILKRAREGDWIARYATAAMAHFLLAATLGIFIGLNKHLGWVPMDPSRAVSAHFHLAEVGWVTFMILGFGRKLWPPLAPSPENEPGESRLRFWLLETGLLGLTVALLFTPSLVPVFGSLLAIGVLIHFRGAFRKMITRTIRDRASFWTAISVDLATVTLMVGLVLAFGLAPDHRVAMAYGFLALVGWNALAITSLALKLLPMWIWQERFGEDLGKKPVPAMRDLYSRRLQDGTGGLLAGGTVVTGTGILTSQGLLTAIGLWMILAGVLLFGVNVVLMVRRGPPAT